MNRLCGTRRAVLYTAAHALYHFEQQILGIESSGCCRNRVNEPAVFAGIFERETYGDSFLLDALEYDVLRRRQRHLFGEEYLLALAGRPGSHGKKTLEQHPHVGAVPVDYQRAAGRRGD